MDTQPSSASPIITPAFKIGDFVRVTKPFFGSANVGDTGTVDALPVEPDNKYSVSISTASGVVTDLLPEDCLELAPASESVEPDHYPPLDPAASEAQGEQVATEPGPEPKTAMDYVRAFISTVVACINSHCNQPSDADAKIAALKKEIGDGLSAFEHKHMDSVFASIKAGPAPINPLPEAPLPDAPLPPVTPKFSQPGINTGFAK